MYSKLLVSTTGHTDNPNKVTHFTIIRKLRSIGLPHDFEAKVKTLSSAHSIGVEGSERALLNSFMTRLIHFDPDVIVGHNFYGYDLDVLLHRMRDLNTAHWYEKKKI